MRWWLSPALKPRRWKHLKIGAKKVSADEVRNTPVLFGEADVIKALQTQPGVTEGTEGYGRNVCSWR